MAEPNLMDMPWWRVALDVAIALGTVGAVLVALFGQAFRAKFFPPKLTLTLADELGEAIPVALIPPEVSGQQPRQEAARYFHLRVTNGRRWSPATGTHVVLLQVEEPGPDGKLQIRWTGDIPLAWRHNTVFPPYRAIGPHAFADLCSVVKGKWLQLHTVLIPFNLETIRRNATALVASVQARATEGDSNVLRVRIFWDGGWADGAQEMRRHLKVEVDREAV